MRKFLLFTALVVAFTSCGDDDSPIKSSYPTDGLSLEKKSNALLLMGSDKQNPTTAAYEAYRLMSTYEHTNRLNTVNMFNSFINPEADSIMMEFQSPSAPYFVVGPTEIMLFDLEDEVKMALREKPLLAVSHAVSQNDTAWIIDHKVKFFEDTIYDQIYIDTYMLTKVKAQVYNSGTSTEVDLRMAATPDLIKNPALPLPFESQWDVDIYSMDSSKVLAARNTPYYYQNVFLDKFDSISRWGFKLGSYWPFNGEFYNGDIIGTKDTPIRHYFRKPKKGDDEALSGFNVKFMSVVWILDPSTGSMKHANSYISSGSYKIP